ncbi:MAG TPA: class I SAM-dependent RNA methyltransferase [Lacunisphaera sp.]|nr:class I SAM-dependent RNA methyltransferase [Lacunisphaera sp.]HQY04514.1 class I SAM-dependent RNA methyltransferase [Lacunisphaera sp.]
MPKKKFNDQPFPYHHELELEVATLTNLGVGLGRVPVGDGQWVVMVPFTLPGEKVRVRVYRNHKNYSEADLVTVLTPSPHRIDPKCPLFGQCGGCQYQHLTYAEQLKWKRQQVEELLKFMAGVEFAVAPVIGSPREFGYRSKITPHFRAWPVAGRGEAGSPGSATPATTNPIGFLKQGTRFDLIDVPRCEIATEEINAKLPDVRERTRQRLVAGEYKRDATLLLRHAQEGVVTDYDAVIHEKVGELRLHFLARDFFQNNPFILPAFTGYVREQAAGSGAKFLVDAYCGSGLFALSCAPAFERVAGIELSATSVKFATENAAANGIANATFRAGDAAQIFAGLDFAPTDTAVVIDPPRKGCDEPFLNQLFAFGPRAVVYVSCDPATQMRDLKGFLAAGYRLTAVQPFDLFPQTRHLECVITLVKR